MHIGRRQPGAKAKGKIKRWIYGVAMWREGLVKKRIHEQDVRIHDTRKRAEARGKARIYAGPIARFPEFFSMDGAVAGSARIQVAKKGREAGAPCSR